MIFIDTNVAIDLRDKVPGASDRLRAMRIVPVLSIISQIELEGGVFRPGRNIAEGRAALNALLSAIEVIPFDHRDGAAYGKIVEACGFNRPRILDRLIAAQALTRNASLVTANKDDFADIPGLTLIAW